MQSGLWVAVILNSSRLDCRGHFRPPCSAHHARRGWLLARNRVSGTLVIALLAALIVTGYALYYVVTDLTRGPVSIAHWVVGVALVPLLIVHVALGRRANDRRTRGERRVKRKGAAHPSAR